MKDEKNDNADLERRLESLEIRVKQLESGLMAPSGYRSLIAEPSPVVPETVSDGSDEDDKGLESQFGRYGLAWMGNIVLFFGIIFMTVLLARPGHQAVSTLTGYLSASLIFILSWYLDKRNNYLSFIFKINAQVLLYYVTVRLHFFSTEPLMRDKNISAIFLVAIVALQVYMAVKEKSGMFAFLSVIFALITGVIIDSKFSIPLSVTVASLGVVYYYYRFKWEALIIFTIIAAYISLFFWLMGNPFVGHPFQINTALRPGVYFLFGLGAIWSMMLIFREKSDSSDDFLISVTFVNGILFSILLMFITLGFFSKNYLVLFSILSVFCLGYSTFIHRRSGWNFGSAYYALYGFMTMSIALYGLAGLPDVYFYLSVQSLVVVSMGLWFRNRLIIVMNSLLFLTILLLYMFMSVSVDAVNFSFAITALVSARIINWKKERLQIKTDMMRNLYLIIGFVMVLFSLLHAVPRQFITLSWTLAALCYFLAGYLLRNVKYRYLSLATILSTVVYFFIIDLARIEIIYRVMALLFLAIISIGISIIYTTRIKKSQN